MRQAKNEKVNSFNFDKIFLVAERAQKKQSLIAKNDFGKHCT
jgi:hypothetical protein